MACDAPAGATPAGDGGFRLPAWARAVLPLAAAGGVVWEGLWLIARPSSRIAHLLIPALLLPVSGCLVLDSVRRMQRPAGAVERGWMVPWSVACLLVVGIAMILLFDNYQDLGAFVYGALAATPSFFFVAFFEIHYRFPDWVVVIVNIGLAAFVVEWLAIWSGGMYLLWKRRPIPLAGIAGAHFGLGLAVLAALDLWVGCAH